MGVVVGLFLATFIFLLGIGAGYRQFSALKRVRAEPFMAGDDRRYLRQQATRRLAISGLLLIISGMIFVYYFSGMDARMDAIPERNRAGPLPPDGQQDQDDKHFTKLVLYYWFAIIAILGVVVGMAIFDVWATRKYWMVRYREIKAEHEAKLHRDLAVYRQQKLNERAKGLKKPDDDTAEDRPVED